MRRKSLLALGAVALLAAAGAGLWWWLNPAPGPLKLKPVTFAELPGWAAGHPADALTAFQRSCAVFAKKQDNDAVGTYAGRIADWREACATASNTKPEAARKFFESAFAPVQILAGRVEQGRFTGYYEPEIFGSRSKHGDYQTPVYGTPKGLVSVDLSLFRPSLKGEKIAGHVENGKLLPFPARAEIVSKGIDAPVLFYASDKIALFFLHIQGSGRVIFDDGTQARVAYAAQNGQPYTAIGKTLIARGVPREGMSLQVIRAWLKAHPQEADAVMNTDASYIFFELQPVGDASLGAKGAQGVPLTPLASLAVDNRIHGLGTPLYVAGDFPLGRLFIAQDIGGAIRGPIRGDVYFGYGVKAENNAGTQNQMGRYYALLPKAVAARLGAKQ